MSFTTDAGSKRARPKWLLWALCSFIVVAGASHGACQDAAPPVKRQTSKSKAVSFVPPNDTIKVDAVELTGTEEFHRLRVERLQSTREKVVGVPLKNISDKSLRITNIAVTCGCMAAIAESLEINPRETVMVYLRITPTKTGRFGKRVTISFEDSPNVNFVIESVVFSAFDVTPNTLLLKPGDSVGGEITVKSAFGHSGFELTSLSPFLSLKFDRQEKDGSHIFKCQLSKDVDGTKTPADLVVPIRIEHLGNAYDYSLQVYNSESVRIQPGIAFARRNAKNGNAPEFFVIIRYWRNQKDLVCKIVEPVKGLRVTEKTRKPLSNDSLLDAVTYVIEGDTSSVEDVKVNWLRAGEVVGTCQVFVNGRGEVAQKVFRESNRKRNRQLIEQGKASALAPAE